MLENILEYQKKDAMLVKIERELENSESKRVVNEMVEQVKQAQNKLVALERSASQIIAEYEKLKQRFEHESKKLEDVKKVDFSKKSENELRESTTAINRQIASMLTLNKEITKLSNRIVSALNDFEKTKQAGVLAKKKYSESIEKYNKFASNKNNQITQIKADLSNLAKKIDSKVLERYNKMRDDHKFPIFVPLVNNSCGGCAMEVPSARLDLLKKEKMLECESCHRMIYISDKPKTK